MLRCSVIVLCVSVLCLGSACWCCVFVLSVRVGCFVCLRVFLVLRFRGVVSCCGLLLLFRVVCCLCCVRVLCFEGVSVACPCFVFV